MNENEEIRLVEASRLIGEELRGTLCLDDAPVETLAKLLLNNEGSISARSHARMIAAAYALGCSKETA